MKREIKDYYLELLKIGDILENNGLYFKVESPIAEEALKVFEIAVGKQLPNDYVQWLGLTKEIWLMDSYPSGYLGLFEPRVSDIDDKWIVQIGSIEGECDNYYLDMKTNTYYRKIGLCAPEVIEFASFSDLLNDFLQLVETNMTEEYGNRWRNGVLNILLE